MTSSTTKTNGNRAGVSAGPIAGLPPPARRRRPVLIIVGIVLATLAAALVTALLSAATQTTLVWSTAIDVARGHVVETDDLIAVEVNETTATSLLPASVESRDRLVGQVWAADLPAGQLLSAPLVTEHLAVTAGQALVGLRLGPGGFPAEGLRPGDVVLIIESTVQQGQQPTVLVRDAVIESVAELADQGVASDRLVTVSVPEEAAAAVANAGASGRASIAVVSP